MFLPYQVDVPMQRLPLVNWALILLTMVSSVMAFGSEEMLRAWILWRDDDFRVTQLITNITIHIGLLHLAGNMLFLFVFGNAVNAKLGHLWFILSYVALGVLSSLTWYLTGPGEASLGASGAIMGIIGLFLVLYPRNEISCFYFFGIPRLSGTFSVSAYWIILLYILFDVWGLARSGGSTNYVAHLSGMVAGFATGFALVRTGLVRSDRGEQNLLEAMGWMRKPEPVVHQRQRVY